MKHFSRPLLSQIIIAGVIVLLLGGWSYLYAHVFSLRSTHKASSIELAKEEERVRNIQSLRDLIKNTQSDRIKLESFFVEEENIISFLGTVENTASHAEIVFHTSNAQATKEGLTLTGEAEGSFAQTLYFLELLEHLPYDLSIVSFQTSVQNAEEKIWKSTVSLRLKSFIPKEELVKQ